MWYRVMVRCEFVARGFIDSPLGDEDAADVLESGLIGVGAKLFSLSVGGLDIHFLKKEVGDVE